MKKTQVFIDNQNLEKQYAEGLYQDYLERENKQLKVIINEAIGLLDAYIGLLDSTANLCFENVKSILETEVEK